MVDESRLKNSWYTRPDLKPKAAMVKNDPNFDEVAYEQMLQKNYRSYRNQKYAEEKKKSSWYRFFRPLDANYETKTNLYVGRDKTQNYNDKLG